MCTHCIFFDKTIFLYFWVGGIFPLKKYFQRNSMEYFIATAFHKIHLVFRAARQLIWIFWPNGLSFAIWWKKLNCLAANVIRIICRTLCCENIPWNVPQYLNFNPHTKIKIFLQKYRNIVLQKYRQQCVRTLRAYCVLFRNTFAIIRKLAKLLPDLQLLSWW